MSVMSINTVSKQSKEVQYKERMDKTFDYLYFKVKNQTGIEFDIDPSFKFEKKLKNYENLVEALLGQMDLRQGVVETPVVDNRAQIDLEKQIKVLRAEVLTLENTILDKGSEIEDLKEKINELNKSLLKKDSEVNFYRE